MADSFTVLCVYMNIAFEFKQNEAIMAYMDTLIGFYIITYLQFSGGKWSVFRENKVKC